MRQKRIGALLLVAGTCIGSGMIALPMVLVQIGIIPSILLMLTIWFVMYYTSLINLELNLQAGRGLSLGALGRLFSGRGAEFIGTISLKLLSYSLLAVFIYGGSSILQELTGYSFEKVALCYAVVAAALLLLPIKWIDHVNRVLFIGLLGVVGILIAGLAITIAWTDLPLFSDHYNDPWVWLPLIPVVFTSFGFQVIFHTLTNYCKKDAKMLKQAFYWGSLVPAIVYILWTCCILSVVYHDNPQFYAQMGEGKAEVGTLIQVLSHIAKWQSVQILVWWISLLAIATSVLGVGVGLCDSLKAMRANRVVASILTILPAYLVVIYVPNAFIAVLGFAGMILAVIAVLLPAYLLWQSKKVNYHYPELKKKWLIYFSIGVAVIVIAGEIYHMI